MNRRGFITGLLAAVAAAKLPKKIYYARINSARLGPLEYSFKQTKEIVAANVNRTIIRAPVCYPQWRVAGWWDGDQVKIVRATYRPAERIEPRQTDPGEA